MTMTALAIKRDATTDPGRGRSTAAMAAAAIIGLAMAIAGCDLAGTRGEGAVESEARDVGAFSRIEASAGVRVSARIDPARTLEVRAQGNIVPIIVTEVTNDTLRIHTAHGYTSSEGVDVIVATPTLSRIVLSGGSHGTIEGLAADRLDIELSGGSTLTATGTASAVALEMSGGSTAGLENLSAASISVDLSGGGTATVRASDAVHGSATGGSRVTVFGDADLDVDTSGSASIDRG
jgi:hypothetical protein